MIKMVTKKNNDKEINLENIEIYKLKKDMEYLILIILQLK
jgi:hypothetical protein